MRRGLVIMIALACLLGGAYATRTWWFEPGGSPTKAAQPPASPAQPVIAGAASEADVPVQISAIGSVQPIATVLVKSRIDGQIAKIHFKEGQEVQAGDLLFSLDDRALVAQLRQAEANLARDRAQLLRAQQEMKRQEELVRRDYASRQKVEQTQSDAAALEATVRAGEAALESAKVNLSYTAIRSPITGRTGAVSLKEGNVVKANDTGSLVTITQMRPIYVAFTVPERNLAAIRAALGRGSVAVGVTIPGDTSIAENGTLTFIDNQVDATTGTIGLKATFDNRSNVLWPGQFVQVKMTLGVQKNATVVPSAAVQTGQNGFYVFVIRPDSTVQVRPVTVDRTQDDVSVIVDGLKPGEPVVLDGQLRLTEGSRVAPRAAAPHGRASTATTGAGS